MQEARTKQLRKHGWWWFLTAGAVVIIVYLVVTAPVRHLLSPVVAACATLAVLVGIRWHRPRPSRSWYLFAAGLGLFAVADVIFGGFQVAGTLVPFPSAADVLYLAAYPCFAAGLISLMAACAGEPCWMRGSSP
jgi:hypothetical protein